MGEFHCNHCGLTAEPVHVYGALTCAGCRVLTPVEKIIEDIDGKFTAAQKEINRLREELNGISVEERLPDDKVDVLVQYDAWYGEPNNETMVRNKIAVGHLDRALSEEVGSDDLWWLIMANSDSEGMVMFKVRYWWPVRIVIGISDQPETF